LDDKGNYEVTGSISGHDGSGNVLQDFQSNSGQIRIPADLWRQPTIPSGPKKGEFSNQQGDFFTFCVSRSSANFVRFQAPEGTIFRETLVANLPNGPHKLRLINTDGRPAHISYLQIFRPPLSHSDTRRPNQ